MAEGTDQGLSLSEAERESSGKALSVKVRRRWRRCASLDNHNPWYEDLLEERRGLTTKNFIQANMVCTSRVYDGGVDSCATHKYPPPPSPSSVHAARGNLP